MAASIAVTEPTNSRRRAERLGTVKILSPYRRRLRCSVPPWAGSLG